MAVSLNNLPLKIVNVLVYIFLFGSNTYSSVTPGGLAGKETYITPAPYAFYVWTIINLLLLGYVILQFFDQGEEAIVEGVGWRFAGVGILNGVFAHLYATNNPIPAFIIAIFLALVLSHIYYTLQTVSPKSLPTKLFVHLPFSLWHAWSVVLLIISGFAAFGRSTGHKAGIFTDVFVCTALAFLASTSVGYAFSNGTQGDVAGAAVIAWALLGVFSEQRHPAVIHWFALGAFLVAGASVVKALLFAFRSGSVIGNDSERAPLVAGSD